MLGGYHVGASRPPILVLGGPDLEREKGERKRREGVLILAVQYTFGQSKCNVRVPRGTYLVPKKFPDFFSYLIKEYKKFSRDGYRFIGEKTKRLVLLFLFSYEWIFSSHQTYLA